LRFCYRLSGFLIQRSYLADATIATALLEMQERMMRSSSVVHPQIKTCWVKAKSRNPVSSSSNDWRTPQRVLQAHPCLRQPHLGRYSRDTPLTLVDASAAFRSNEPHFCGLRRAIQWQTVRLASSVEGVTLGVTRGRAQGADAQELRGIRPGTKGSLGAFWREIASAKTARIPARFSMRRDGRVVDGGGLENGSDRL
jgi:hypothetical protein